MSSTDNESERSHLVSLADEEDVRKILATTIMSLWEVVNELTRLQPSKHDRYRVAIFGSARANPARSSTRRSSEPRLHLPPWAATSSPAAGRGSCRRPTRARRPSARAKSMGIRVELPFEQDVNPFVEQAFEHKTFFTRLHHFVIASDAFVVVPGGIGTVLETLMIWQLLQVRHVDNVPLILVGKMWKGLVDWASTSMLDPRLQLANPADLKIPLCLDTADEAIAVVRDLHAKWRSP